MTKPKRIAFPIGRVNFFRTLGPVIDAALEDADWEVQLLLGPSVPSTSPRAYLNPTLANIPDRLKKRCQAQLVNTFDELAARLNTAEVVVSMIGRSAVLKDAALRVQSPLWCAVFDGDHNTFPGAHRFDDADLAFWPSYYYLDLAVRRGVGTRSHLEPRARMIGYVRADNLRLTSKDATRLEWGIGVDRPVVLHVPDGGALRRSPVMFTDWYRHIWCVDRLKRLVQALVFRRSLQAVRLALEDDLGHARMIQQLRRFCDRNGAQLVMAQRRQQNWVGSQRFTDHELAAADHIILDNQDYPQTLPRAMQMADLVICGYRSESVMDAVAAGVPYVTVGWPSVAHTPIQEEYAKHFDRERGHWPGVTWVIPARDFIASFAQCDLADFQVDSDARQAFVAKHLGVVDGSCSKRLLQEVKNHLADGHQGRTRARCN